MNIIRNIIIIAAVAVILFACAVAVWVGYVGSMQ